MHVVVLAMLLVLLPAHSQIQRNIRLILIQPPYEYVDADTIATAQQAVIDAATFWRSRTPFPVEMQIVSTDVLTVSADVDVYSDTDWSIGLSDPIDLSHVTIVLIDNRASGKLLFGRHGGWAQPWNQLAVSVLAHMVGANALPAMIAHELGHVLFNLPDLYAIPGACERADIMCYHVAAYNTPTIGCTSLALLGCPCERMLLPIMLRSA